MNKKEEFVFWLSQNSGLSISSIKKYSGAINTISKELKKYSILEENLYDIEDPNVIASMKENYLTIPEYNRKDERGNRMYSNALQYYLIYRKTITVSNSDISK